MQEINFRVGNYEAMHHIADGAFGCVYLVQHRYLKRRFAMKLLNIERQQSAFERERFLREAHYLDILHHRGIPQLFDSGIEADGTSYIVLEYAPNGTLRNLINRYPFRQMPFKQALAILDGIVEALGYVHAQGILHHDIKPENVLFRRNWEVMLADFGIALAQEEVTLHRAAARVGTPAYMAPEQYHGYASRRTDQYSLAVLAYEIFTGRLPFEASTRTELQEEHFHARPLPPSCHNSALPPWIDAALLKALEKQRVNRFDSIRSFRNALHGAPIAPARVLSTPAAMPALRSNVRGR